ncbi:MAG TPA: TIGR04255 family protein [Pyrinomonadaceae bacterium]
MAETQTGTPLGAVDENTASSRAYPNFDRPPVIEVVLSVQFNPVEKLRGPQIGLLWAAYKDRFPQIEEHIPLDPVLETFGVRPAQQVSVKFELSDVPPIPRVWFLNERGDQLIQVQQDRFIHNWRKVAEEDEYPRYGNLTTSFRNELDLFGRFLEEEQLGDLSFNQCEVTYVNHILAGDVWSGHGDLNKVLTLWAGKHSDSFLPEAEDVRLATRYIIPGSENNPLGRLHVIATPAFRISDKRALIVLNLTARCRPDGEGLEGVFSSLDKAHEWVVRGFTSITTEQMHQVWRRRDDS